MISVIVPVYNTEKYLRNCLNSIINQTYRELEIIIVDDGSPDDSGKICDEYADRDSRIVVVHQNNKGLSGARNAGLDICKGEYVMFVDSDDTISLQMAEKMLFAIENVDIAICDFDRITKEYANNNSVTYSEENDKLYITKDEIWSTILIKLNNASWNKLYRRTLIGNIRFPTGLVHGEDLVFNLKYISKCNNGVIIKEKLYNYFQRKDSITQKAFTQKRFDEITIKDMVRDIVEGNNARLLNVANKYCFRARMNVIRAIYLAGKEDEYNEQIRIITEHAKRLYLDVHVNLDIKERLEYIVFCKIKCLYRMAIILRRKYISKNENN